MHNPATPFEDASALLADPIALRRRARREGYLFLPGLLPPEAVAAAGDDWRAVLADAEWIQPGTDPRGQQANPQRFALDPEPDFLRVYQRLYRSRAFHALPHHPRVTALLEALLAEPVLVHPNAVGRIIFPGRDEYTTPVHQDWPSIECALDQWNLWVPLQDCPRELGGLIVAAGQHRFGPLDFQPALGAAGYEIAEAIPEDAWRGGDFALGDAILFNSLLPHAALPNRTARLRLSADYRFQRATDWVAAEVLQPQNRFLFSWEDSYRDWPTDDPLKYYWQRQELTVLPRSRWQARLVEKTFAMAEQQDYRARSSLTRIAVRNPDPRIQQRARDLLAQLEGAGPPG